MKQILIILSLLASVSTFAQSPRIKLNQITKDSISGSVLISSPSDSGMVYSRDFYIAYGADTVLILYGDTLAATSGIISSVLSDGVTITGDGTSGNELKVDTATVIATKGDLSDYVTIAGTETISGAKTFTSALTQSGGDVNFDSGTLFVDESANRVGINTNTPQAPLSVVGSIHILDVNQASSADNNIYVYNDTDAGSTNGTTDAEFSFYVAKDFSTSSNDGPFFIMRGSDFSRFSNEKGAIFFAAATISSPTNDQGTINFITDGNIQMTIEADGDVVMANDAYINGNTLVTSDFNLKNNINDYKSGLNKLMQFRPVSFYLNNDDENILNFGFIAQEIESIVPELVRKNNKNGTLYLNYDHFIPIITNAIQEQQTIIESQANEIETLKSQIQLILSEIEQIKNN